MGAHVTTGGGRLGGWVGGSPLPQLRAIAIRWEKAYLQFTPSHFASCSHPMHGATSPPRAISSHPGPIKRRPAKPGPASPGTAPPTHTQPPTPIPTAQKKKACSKSATSPTWRIHPVWLRSVAFSGHASYSICRVEVFTSNLNATNHARQRAPIVHRLCTRPGN